jgi:hypothetical protein
MAIDARYEQANNDYLATWLRDYYFDPTELTPHAFKNTKDEECGALLVRGSDSKMAVLMHTQEWV